MLQLAVWWPGALRVSSVPPRGGASVRVRAAWAQKWFCDERQERVPARLERPALRVRAPARQLPEVEEAAERRRQALLPEA